MDEDDTGGRDAVLDALVATLSDPAGNAGRTPQLLGVLDGGDPDHRLAAATALCLVAGADSDVREVVVERLLDRLDGEPPVEVPHALAYLATRYPDTVEAALSDLGDETARRARERLVGESDGGFTRSEYHSVSSSERPVGRTRVAGRTDVDDPRQVDTNDEEDPDEPETDGETGDTAVDGAGDGSGSTTSGAEGTGETTVESGEPSGVTSVALRAVSRRLSDVVETSDFDELTVLTEGRRDRYGVTYRSASRRGGEEYAVALRVYRLPDDHESFAAGFRTVMAAWEELGSHPAMLPVYDWSVRPRPWAAVEYVDESLATLPAVPVEPLWTVLEVATAVGRAHQQGLVHGAIDPGNVVYRDAALDVDTRRQPLLTNPGIAALSGNSPAGGDRSVDESGEDTGERIEAGGLDPRYAAPEHYDDSYGRVDAATDVYGLGALLFRLCTDRHPYTGDAETVRGKVLSEQPPDPLQANPDLPESLRRVLGKATATRKIKRYETVTAFEQELDAARDRLLAEVDDA